MPLTVDQIARQYLATRSAMECAGESLKMLDAQLKREMIRTGVSQVECAGQAITLAANPGASASSVTLHVSDAPSGPP